MKRPNEKLEFRKRFTKLCYWLVEVLLGGMIALLAIPGFASEVSSCTVGRFLSSSPGNIFWSASSELHFVPSSQVLGQTIRFTITNEIGAPTGESERLATRENLRITLPGRGYFSVEARTASETNARCQPATTSAAVLGVDLSRWAPGSWYGVWHVNADPGYLRSIGAGWTRRLWTVRNFSPTPGQVGSRLIDHDNRPIVKGYGLNWVGVLALGFPDWLTGKPGVNPMKELYPPRNWNAFAQIVRRFLTSVTPLPDYFEVYNEPDAAWRGTAEQLVQLHRIVARELKRARRDVQVLGPTSYSVRIPYIKQLVDAGLLDTVDGLSIHAYVTGTPPEQEFYRNIVSLREYLDSIGKRNFPLYITEFGWTSAKGTWQTPVSPLTQAQYVTRSFALLATQSIKSAIYFCLLWKGAAHSGLREFSVMNNDLTPKPAFVALATTFRWLSRLQVPARLFLLSPTTYLVLAKSGERGVVIAWDVSGSAPIPLPENTESGEDMMGRALHLDPSSPPLVGAGPSFFLINDAAFVEMQITDVATIERPTGGTFRPSWTPKWAPKPLQIRGDSVHVPSMSPAGSYKVLGRATDGKWYAASVIVSDL